MNIYVANLVHEATTDDLHQLFGPFGTITNASLIKDKFSGQSRGFGFVEMSSKQEGQAAIDALNGKDFKGRPLTVNEARPKSDNARGDSHRSGGFGKSRHDRW